MQPTAGRRTAPHHFMKSRPLLATLVDSFAPAQLPLPSRLYRLPRGVPGRGVDSHVPDALPFALPVHVAPLPAGSILASGG